MASASATHNPEKRGVGYGLASTGLSSPRDADMVLVKNTSGADRARFEILGISAPVFTPTDNLEEFRNRVVLSGVCPVKVDVANANHWHADIADNSAANLKSGGGGAAQILWKESGTGVKWAVVRLGRWSPTVFPVNLTQTGGSQGTTTTPASWTYSVIDPVTSQTLATGVNPTVSPHKWKRPSAGWMIAATFGYAHFNAQGQLVLGWINEMVEQEACSS